MAQTKQMIVETFKKFDLNKDGQISKDELSRVLGAISGGQFGDDEIDALLKASDQNKDGFISYEEFVDWVTKDMEKPSDQGTFRPIDKRGSFQVDYRKLLPERFSVDIAARYNMDKGALGEGGFGKVFIATDKEMSDRKVAVKRVQKPRSSKSSQAELNDLQKEITVMKDMDHPNICKLLATFEEGQYVFFIMELCEGGELFDRIIESGLVSESLSAIIVKQVASALSYAHGRGIAHRDIKPENVVFCTKDKTDYRVKLIDWGLATSFAGDQSMTKAVGSMTYAAPEVIASQDRKAYTEACDLWSLGVLTYVMLCGKPPFWGTREQHYRAAKNERYPFKDDPWDKSSMNTAKDFIKNLLKANPASRLTVKQCCEHAWLQNAREEDVNLNSEQSKGVMNNLKSFAGQTTFTRLCITAVARQLDHTHLKDIHAVFRELDKDGNGVLSVQEVSDGIAKLGGGADVEKLFNNMDIDGSKNIDYTEFCAAAMGEKACSQDDIIWAAFKTFDVDNTGFLSLDNLKHILDNTDVQDCWSPEVCREVGQEIISKFDTEGKGQINFEDFKKMMEKCWKTCNTKSLDALDILSKVNTADLAGLQA